MDPLTDEVLIKGILIKDEAIIKHFIELYQDHVYQQAFRLLRNKQDAEEACQEIFIKALKKMNNFRGDSKLSTWLYRISYMTCLDYLKKRKRKFSEEVIDEAGIQSWDDIENALTHLEQKQQRHLIDTSILKLGNPDALLMDLYYLQELGIQDIAEITDMTKENVKVRLYRSRIKLAAILTKVLPSETIKQYRK
jgi:RNA polymerase sigma-70 factor (ECF subfamily)